MIIAVLNSCAGIPGPTPEDENARLIIARLAHRNDGLTQFKGLANIRMTSEGQTRSGRVAFAAVQPDKMRVELLNTVGIPLTSLSGDGEYIVIRSHGDNKYYRFRQSRTALASVIQVPIGIEDLLSLLAGKVPFPAYTFAQMVAVDKDNEVIVLKNRWRGRVARLTVDSKSQQMMNMQVFDSQGERLYQIEWLGWEEVGTFRIPSKLMIESLPDQRLTLTVDRYWPNVEVPQSTFVLDASRNRS